MFALLFVHIYWRIDPNAGGGENYSVMRQDAWTHEDDTILADTTLRHIQEGSTQLAAFAEIAKKLNRTPAACGYRWNASIRRQHLEDISHAKQMRKERREELGESGLEPAGSPLQLPPSFTWGEVLRFLRSKRREFQMLQIRIKQLQREVEFANQETDRLSKEKQGLEQQIIKLADEYKAISDDYHALLGIVERARERGLGMPQDI